MNALAQLITPNNISLDIDVPSRDELFTYIAKQFEKNHAISADLVKTCLEEREALGSTSLGSGIAIPHGRVKQLTQAHIGFVRLKNGIDFKSPDQQPVKAIVIMLVLMIAIVEILVNGVMNNHMNQMNVIVLFHVIMEVVAHRDQRDLRV